MISRLRSLTDRIDAYHAELHQVEEDVAELMGRRDALVTQLTDLGILVSVARKLVPRVELVIGWPEEKAAVPSIFDGVDLTFGTHEPTGHKTAKDALGPDAMPPIPASLDRRGK